MSLLFFENDTRFKSSGNDESDLSSNTNKNKTNGDNITLNGKPTATSKLLKNESTNTCTTTTANKSKKTCLNQSSSHSISPLVLNDNSSNGNQLKDSNGNSKEQLNQFVTDKENHLLNVCNEYDQQYENFFKIAKKYHLEKLNNLKLQFKNQILKQQIYFETELLEISKECNREYENYSNKSNKSKNSNNKRFEREKQLVKLYKIDMKRLIDYMKEALINSSDTLMEAFETCKVLKSLEQVEKSAQKQNTNLKNSTKNLLSYKNDSSKKLNDNNSYNLTVIEDDDNNDEMEKKLTDEQIQFNKYQVEMDELMHVLDDIELQHLQRKDQLTSKTKFVNKLKSKFKFIENKYETLNKQITNLKYESYIYKELWREKQRSQMKSKLNEAPSSSSSSNNKQTSSYYFNSSTKSSTMSSSLSPSTSSRSSSTSSLSDCYHDAIDTSDSSRTTSSSNSSSSNTSCSSSSSSSSSILSEIIDNELDEFDYLNINDNVKHHDNKSASTSNSKLINNGLSTQDYNRKLNLINNLISLHKAKQSSKDIWTYKNSELTNHINSSRFNYLNDVNNENSNNINNNNNNNNMNENDDIFSNVIIDESDNLISNSANNSKIIISNNGNFLKNKQNSCSLDLCECSTYGDKVIVENFNLKLDHDISNWYITRQIENMSIINKYRLPKGSIIKSGKVLKINEPFQNDQIDFLLAIKQKQVDLEGEDHSTRLKKICLKIITKLVTPDGIVKSIHTQEVPQFYQEIFKYANLIQFL
jgi:hypothetical protein